MVIAVEIGRCKRPASGNRAGLSLARRPSALVKKARVVLLPRIWKTVMEYVYGDVIRPDLLPYVPADGKVIGTIGCGSAFWEMELIKQGREVHGADVSSEAVEQARGRITSIKLIDPSDRMPFDENSLDGLILADVIEHIPLAWEYLASYTKMVKPGGWIMISVPNLRQIGILKVFVFGGEWQETETGIFDKTHVQVMTKRRLARWCEMAGIEIERWLVKYDPRPTHRRIYQIADTLTLGLFRSWFMFQLQMVGRRKSPVATPSPELANAVGSAN
jgi:2-polyprenyl-3-methyl-5-hydroxy-6-metoxy-1,4-benzoquinol methylase